MKRRLYYLFPGKKEAIAVVNELLLKYIPVNDMHVLSHAGADMEGLPEATIFQRNDAVRATIMGLVLGSIIGLVAGIIGHYVVDMPVGGAVIATTIIGAIIGGWSSSLIALSLPNAHLKRFQASLKAGNYLLMVDLNKERVDEIETLMAQLHPEANFKGLEPTIPKFP